jgi:hypothetical protein
MTALVWANFPLALLFLLAWAGIPPWMAHHHPDYAVAHPYPAAKAASRKPAAAAA